METCCVFKRLQATGEELRTTDTPGTTAALAGLETLPQIAGALASNVKMALRSLDGRDAEATKQSLGFIACRDCLSEIVRRRAEREAAKR